MAVANWVAVGDPPNGVIYSDDGNSWNDASGWEGYMISVSYGYSNGTPIWVALGSGTNNIFTSTNGSSWTGIHWPGGGGDYIGYYGKAGAAYGTNGAGSPLWVAVGAYGGLYDILISPDAQTWNGTNLGGGGVYTYDVAYGTDSSGSPLWIATGDDSIFRSTTGSSWSAISFPGGFNGLGIAYGKDDLGNPLWVAVGYEISAIYWSPDGQTWTSADTTFGQLTMRGYDVAYGTDGSGNPLWVAVGGAQGIYHSIKTSTNGKSWTPVNVAFGYLYTVSFGKDNTGAPLWKAVGDEPNNNIVTSSDGTTWSGINWPGGGSGYGIAYAAGPGPGPGPLPCFLKGTRILTPSGYKQIETLESGDHILTSDGRKVKANLYTYTIERATEETAPYKIPAGALGNYLPSRDLHISGNHAIQDGNKVWQIPRYLAQKNATIHQHSLGEAVRYYHIECPNYRKDNLIAEGVTAESLNAKKEKVIWTKTKSGYVRELKTEYLVFNKKH